MSAPADFRHSHHPRKKLSDEHGSPFAVAHSLHPPSSTRAGVACSTFHMTMPVPRSRIERHRARQRFAGASRDDHERDDDEDQREHDGDDRPARTPHDERADRLAEHHGVGVREQAAASCLRRGCIAEKMPVHPRISTLFRTIATRSVRRARSRGRASPRPRSTRPTRPAARAPRPNSPSRSRTEGAGPGCRRT